MTGVSTAPAAAPLRREPDRAMVAGVCSGLAARFGVDALWLRLAFVVVTVLGGIGFAIYGLLWWVMPAEGGARGFRLPGGAKSVQVAAGIGLLMLSLLLILRDYGLWFGDATVWPTVLVVAGAALLWRQSGSTATAEDPAAPAVAPGPATDVGERERRAVPFTERLEAAARGRAALGAALIVGGALVFLWLNDALRPARDVILALVVMVLAAALILAPWWLRLVRGLSAERAERIRSQERAEVAAHLHDSVLQTLALVQRRADDPRAVAALARRQERELRAWLNGGTGTGEAPGTLAAALRRAAADVEDDHGAEVDVVTVGDRALDERTEAVAAAAREALTNAAKFAGDAPISLYAEMGPERVEVFVRDRGPGFTVDAVPADRRGVRESILGRMARHGGRAAVAPGPGGAGTEVELVLER
jgi:signal transduction histidine kinase/phage shock protein PspC (stress-responsive transcriptional regulator)